jgi:predicted membrane protein
MLRMAYKRVSSQALLGGGIALLGVVLLLYTTRLFDTRFALDYVPSLFVFIGLYALVTSRFRNVVGPLLVVLAAGAWQLVALDYVTPGEVASFWPAVLVIFGLSVVAGRFRRRTTAVDNAQIDLLALFGSNERRATVREFVGGDLTALFGSVELDLRDTEVATPPARINATALFGAVDITVPREWNVHMDVLPVLGAAEDDRLRREEEHEEIDLVVTGFTAFGAVSVTD